ncbi:hypothetical protein SAMN06265222_101530 [Neorhodopirellula lusitana]|uniref:Uncharacterized protein n=2 Tax=Neorhodopirellula lusitana TaxID=445327 RepID=A0ABY1PPY5_9BACT|nr:hypothetical protein SAMN06265222_101530 [Neorhodopirellula lusitana]
MSQTIWGQIMTKTSRFVTKTEHAQNDQSKQPIESPGTSLASLSPIHANLDRLFCVIIALQSLSIVAVAMFVTPNTWLGRSITLSSILWFAAIYGVCFCVVPAGFLVRNAVQPRIRHWFAVAQVVWSGILIYLSGGSTITHACIFASLALLSLYRDYRVLLTVTFLSGTDYLIRSFVWPQSLHGQRTVLSYQWLQHLNWLVIATGFFSVASLFGRREFDRLFAGKNAPRTHTNLNASNKSSIRERRQQSIEAALAEEPGFDATLRACDALENQCLSSGEISELLKQVSISVQLLHQESNKSRVNALAQAAETLSERENNLAEFFTKDRRGKHFPGMLKDLSRKLLSEHETRQSEIEMIKRTIHTICELSDAAIPQTELESCEA